jgi:2,4-dienoyl-CoA reductase-like NADH-dependent reductase (Old Yellow Enzyme family)
MHWCRNHPGRQSPVGAGKRSFFAKNIAPSAIPLNLGDNWIARCASAIVFGTPRAMTQKDIDDVVAAFASAANMAFCAGFQGVEVHAGRE